MGAGRHRLAPNQCLRHLQYHIPDRHTGFIGVQTQFCVLCEHDHHVADVQPNPNDLPQYLDVLSLQDEQSTDRSRSDIALWGGNPCFRILHGQLLVVGDRTISLELQQRFPLKCSNHNCQQMVHRQGKRNCNRLTDRCWSNWIRTLLRHDRYMVQRSHW